MSDCGATGFLRGAALGLALAAAGPGAAQEADEALTLELNAAETVDTGCLLSFVVRSTLARDAEKMVAEMVLFSRAGDVLSLTLFDFGALPAGRMRVRQFEVPGQECAALGQVLVNGVNSCVVGGTESGDCARALALSSRLDIALEG